MIGRSTTTVVLSFLFLFAVQAATQDTGRRSSSRLDALDALLEQAVSATRAYDFTKALALYGELERSGAQWYAWAGTSGLVAVHRMMGDGESARAISARISLDRPELAGLMAIWDGDTAATENDLEGALASYETAAELHGDQWVDGRPIGAVALEQISRARLALADANGAAEAQRRLLERYPRFGSTDLTRTKILAFEAMEAGELPLKPLEKLVHDGDCSPEKPCVLGQRGVTRTVPRDAVSVAGGFYLAPEARSAESFSPDLASRDILSAVTACTPPPARDGFQTPFNYSTSAYGYRFMSSDCCSGYHPGVDLNAAGNDCELDFHAVAKGCVRDVMSSSTDWGTAAVEHSYAPGLWTSQYGHGDRVYYSVGQAIAKGAALGNIDTIGKSTGCHLHFEIREEDHPARNNASAYHNSPLSIVGDQYQDPETFIASHRSYQDVKWVDEDSFTFSGTWQSVTGIGNQDDLKWAYTTGSYTNYARHKWTPSATGTTEIWAFVPWNHATSTRAPIKVINQSTGATVMSADVNQSIYYDAWIKIGSAVLYANTTYSLEVASNTAEGGKKVAVDDFLIIRIDTQQGNCLATPPSNRWKGQYFDNMTLSGNPVMVRDDGSGALDFDWGSGSPGSSCGVPADNFSARWTRTAYFNAGTYQVTVTSDDGFRLYVDGVLKLDKWIVQGPTTYNIDVALSAGNHTIRMDYFENGGGAVAKLDWKLVSNCFTSVPSTSWKGEYFNNKTLSGSPAMIRNDGTGFLDFGWNSDSPSPSCGFPADNFSVRWTRSVYFSAGTYQFDITSDDGFKLYVDGVLKRQAWIDQGPTDYSVDVPLSAGYHTIKLEYYENGGWAVAKLSWKLASSNPCLASVPSTSWKGEYFNNKTLSGSPTMIRNDGTGFLDFGWYSDSPSPSCGFPADNFSVRWTRSVYFSAGTYQFNITSDDGFKLYVDGVLKRQAWIDQGPTDYSVDVPLSAGYHTIKLEYYENGGWAVAKLSWKLASSNPCLASVPSTSWKGEYFNNKTLSGSPAMVRNDGTAFLNFDWGGGSPGSSCGIGVDNFSVRWTRTVSFNAGTYRFTVTSDDGFKLYVDGVLKLSKWIIQAPTTYTVDVPLSGGNHIIRVDYFENGGGAVAKLSWKVAPEPPFRPPVLRQVIWRGGVGYSRAVPFEPGFSGPDWARATGWETLSASSLSGAGTIQTWDTYPMQSGLLESYWRDNKGYHRTVPWAENGGPDYALAPAWSGPIEISSLPGAGNIQAQDSFRVGNVLWQSIWRGDEGWYRTVPVDSAGAPIWQQAGPWNGPLGLDGLPGMGSIQSQSAEVYPDGRELLQSIWRSNQGYWRTVPIDSAGNILWSQARPWSSPIPISNLPGAGSMQAQAGAVYSVSEIPVRLMVIIYNPIIESQGGRKLTEVLGWNDPDELTGRVIAAFNSATRGIARYHVVERIERDEWPIHVNGKRYTDALYLQEWANRSFTLGPGDYNAIIRDHQIAEKVNAGQVDEVFLWGFPGAGWWESAMAGTNSYWINGGPINGVDSRAFILMGLNYERGLAEALESYGHRTESILRRIYGSWEAAETHDWNRFTLLDRDLAGRGGIGNAHNAFNAETGTDYNRTSKRFVLTSADDWLRFPNMTGARTSKNCDAWGCKSDGYLIWWYNHMPHVSGLKNGILNDWWRYLLDPAQYAVRWKFSANDNETPRITILQPSLGSTVRGTVPVRVSVADDNSVFQVDLYIDNEPYAIDAIAPYVFFWDTRSLANGVHTLTLKAYDQAGNRSLPVSTSVQVAN